jgi:hypothetical protein
VPLEANLREILTKKDLTEEQVAEKLVEVIPNLNHDQLVHLSLHTAFESKINDKAVWRAIEDAAISAMHLLTLTQVSQIEWATTQLKPKQTTARLNTLLMQRAL